MVGAQLSEALYSIFLTSGQVVPLDHLFRDEDEDLRFLSIPVMKGRYSSFMSGGSCVSRSRVCSDGTAFTMI